jgi:glyoxylase-like metal-dependent hydrolase (beta-lactamase superfamily II)
VHTPGHTAGSVCYFWEAEGMVFSGDAVQGHGWRAGAAPIYHDVGYVDSLNRIDQLNASTLCMGHTFGWNGVLNDPVRRGAEVHQTLQASRDVSGIFDRAAALALELRGMDAAFTELAQTAFEEVVYDLALQWDRRTRVPVVAARAISAHLYAHGWKPVST